MLFMVMWKHLMEWWKERQSSGTGCGDGSGPSLPSTKASSPKAGRGGGAHRGCSRFSRPYMAEAMIAVFGFMLVLWGLLPTLASSGAAAIIEVDATPSYESLQLPRTRRHLHGLEEMHRIDAMLASPASGEWQISDEKDAGGCDHQPETPIVGSATLLSPAEQRISCKHPSDDDAGVPDEEDRMWGHGEIQLRSCTNPRPPEKLAYVVAYDMYERASKSEKRNAQFHRLFRAIKSTGAAADLVLLVPTLASPKLPLLVRGLKEAYGVKVIEAAWPIHEEELAPHHLRLLEQNTNCCGWREFYKLAAWSLTQ